MYLKRLIIERHHIRGAIENPGGSVILTGVAATTERTVAGYSSDIGNDQHLDLIEAEMAVNKLDAPERIALLLWCDGLTSQEAAQFMGVRPGTIRARTSRAVKRIVNDAGRTSNSAA